jgi:FkbM family methyltransferase
VKAAGARLLAGVVLAGSLAPLPACKRAAAPAPLSFDIRPVVSADLLRKANRGRDVLAADSRLVLPARVRRVWIDVGAHLLETTRDELEEHSDMALVAIEPLEECWITWPDRARLIALPVAISTERGFMDFHVNASNATSSLLQTVNGNMVDGLTKTVQTRKVPVLRLQDVLERIAPDVEVEYLKTDVQGHDLQVLKSAGSHLRRVRAVKAEIINAAIYEGTGEWRPGTEAEFVAYMDSQGFAFEKDTSVRQGRAWLDKWFVNRNPPVVSAGLKHDDKGEPAPRRGY